eukprot:gene46246-35025_t
MRVCVRCPLPGPSPHVHTLGVADGVGGWRDMGIDPGGTAIARALMHNAQALCEKTSRVFERTTDEYILPHWLLAEAYWKIKYAKQEAKPKQYLFSANLGDSGWILLRDGKHQRVQHNTPMQLAMIPESLRTEGYINNEPYQASVSTHEVKGGDVLVLWAEGAAAGAPCTAPGGGA